MPIFTAILGLVFASVAALAAYRIAASAERRPATAYGLCAFVVAVLVYGGTLQTLILYVNTSGPIASVLRAEAVYAAFAALSGLIATASGIASIAAWTRLTRTAEAGDGRLKTSGLALLFSVAVTILAAPFLIQNQITIERSIDANLAEIAAFKQSYTNGLEKLTRMGALSRIEVGDDAVTHYIGDPLYKVGEQGLAEYARAAMIYHTQVLGNDVMPVVLRDSTTEAKIGTFRTDSVFVVHVAAQDQGKDQASKLR